MGFLNIASEWVSLSLTNGVGHGWVSNWHIHRRYWKTPRVPRPSWVLTYKYWLKTNFSVVLTNILVKMITWLLFIKHIDSFQYLHWGFSPSPLRTEHLHCRQVHLWSDGIEVTGVFNTVSWGKGGFKMVNFKKQCLNGH